MFSELGFGKNNLIRLPETFLTLNFMTSLILCLSKTDKTRVAIPLVLADPVGALWICAPFSVQFFSISRSLPAKMAEMIGW